MTISQKDREKYSARLVNVFISHSMASEEKLSRSQYMEFINTAFKKYKYENPDQLMNGEAYCVLFNDLFPNTISENKIESGLNLNKQQMLKNWKLLQEAFNLIGVDKFIEVGKIIDGNRSENYEFLQWYKQFYSRNIFIARAERNREENTKKSSGSLRKSASPRRKSVSRKKSRSVPKKEKKRAGKKKPWYKCGCCC